MQRGIQRWEAAILIWRVRRKFGSLEKQDSQKIESADTETLLDWSERLLTADSIEEIYQ